MRRVPKQGLTGYWHQSTTSSHLTVGPERLLLTAGEVSPMDKWTETHAMEIDMAWSAPKITEHACGMEISRYLPAEDDPLV